MNKLNASRYHELTKRGDSKITVYMNDGHKWMIEELAHAQRISQKQVLFDILQYYWEKEVPHTKKQG